MRRLAIVIICLLALFTLINAYTREGVQEPPEPARAEVQQESETG